jgi:hypothetical protein
MDLKSILESLIRSGVLRTQIADVAGIDRQTVRHILNGKGKYLLDRTFDRFKEAFPNLFPETNIWCRKQSDKKRCKEHRCFGWACTFGYCDKHYREFKEHGRIREACEKRAPRGQGHLDRHGYIRISREDGTQTFQHRLIMELKIGRRLFDHENVHHLNGIRNDNRFENLELWSKSQPAGQKIEDKIKWAKEFLTQYGYKVCKTH